MKKALPPSLWMLLISYFSAYLILALLVYPMIKALGAKYAKGFSLLFCMLYAMTDEFHQLCLASCYYGVSKG